MVIMFFMPEKRQTGLPNFEWAGALRACIGTLVGIGLGVPFCIVLDPYPRDFDHVGATLACLAVGVMGGGGGGCYLSLVRGVKRRAAKAAVGVVLLLSFAAPIAVISGTALERMAGGDDRCGPRGTLGDRPTRIGSRRRLRGRKRYSGREVASTAKPAQRRQPTTSVTSR